MQVVFQAGNQRRSATGSNLLNSSQVMLSPSEVRVHPYKSFSVTQAGHQRLFMNSSVVAMTGLQRLEQLNAGRSLRTTSVGYYAVTVTCMMVTSQVSLHHQ